jgi:AraC-like DNA-binding protein
VTIAPIPIIPKHTQLQQHISYYYFLKTDDDFETRYYAFPHINTVLNIHQHASFDIKGLYTKVYGDATNPYDACVQGIRELPLLAHLTGKLNKVTIIFKPLGINHFIDHPFGDRYTLPSDSFDSWDSEPQYHNFLGKFYTAESNDEKSEVLENFLLAMLRPLPAYAQLHTALQLLSNWDRNLSVDEICESIKLNARTFSRLFKKHLGVSPVTYRKVARFRHSLENKHFDSKLKRLTDIAYQSNYYDQAYFNKMYRSLTGSNPQRFFNKVDSLADDMLIFEFMER